MNDTLIGLAERVRQAAAARRSCAFRGGSTKQAMAGVISDAATLDMRAYSGIVDYAAQRARHHRARPARRWSSSSACWPSAASACRSIRRASPMPTAGSRAPFGGMVASGLAGPRPRGRRRRARLRAGRAAASTAAAT